MTKNGFVGCFKQNIIIKYNSNAHVARSLGSIAYFNHICTPIIHGKNVKFINHKNIENLCEKAAENNGITKHKHAVIHCQHQHQHHHRRCGTFANIFHLLFCMYFRRALLHMKCNLIKLQNSFIWSKFVHDYKMEKADGWRTRHNDDNERFWLFVTNIYHSEWMSVSVYIIEACIQFVVMVNDWITTAKKRHQRRWWPITKR